MRCRALPCGAGLCRAAQCCVRTRYPTKVPRTRVYTPPEVSLASSTAHRGAVWCRAVSSLAVWCGAVPYCSGLSRAWLCVLFRTYQTTTLASRHSWREPSCLIGKLVYGVDLAHEEWWIAHGAARRRSGITYRIIHHKVHHSDEPS